MGIDSARRRLARFLGGAAVLALAGLFVVGPALDAAAHDARLGIAGRKVMVRTEGDPADKRFAFVSSDQRLVLGHDPSAEGTSLLIHGSGPNGGSSGLINLDPARWTGVGSAKTGLTAYVYKDPAGSRGGITTVVLQNGGLLVWGKGENWTWDPSGSQEEVWVYFRLEDEWYCSQFSDETGAHFQRNVAGDVLARGATSPGFCPDQLCGNGVHELGEECDDGNLIDGDTCTNTCSKNLCPDVEYASTYDAVRDVVFEGYGCTNAACHGEAMQGGLDLRGEDVLDALLEVDAVIDPNAKLLVASEPDASFLFQKLLAAYGQAEVFGSPMPVGVRLTEEHLEAMRLWIRGGAPREGVVMDTAERLGACLPPADPLVAAVPPPPDPGEGVQIQQTPWDLPSVFENEICMSTHYDFTGTDLVPGDAKVPCPTWLQRRQICSQDAGIECSVDADCGEGNACILKNATNTTNECFAYEGQLLIQDPQSHHSIIHIYTGSYDELHPGWGDYTRKYQDQTNPLEGEPCDPTEIDESLGYNPNCSGEVEESIACILYGPPDFSNFNSILGGGGNSPQFSGSQEPYFESYYADGVFNVLPMRGVVVWNSHAFNLTSKDSTMSQYINLDFAKGDEEQLYPLRGIFDASSIFVQDVPPFETREYCQTLTLPQGAHLFNLSSHTHRWGVQWRTWLPPNTPCRPACPAEQLFGCSNDGSLPECTARPTSEAVYVSSIYNDPLDLDLDPEVVLDSPNVEDRTLMFCSLYDNGSTATSPSVKRQSTSPSPPLEILTRFLGVGGPCGEETVACFNDGPMKGQNCFNDDRMCDSPGQNDGVCDACPVRGGVTTEDEMFIELGSWYLP